MLSSCAKDTCHAQHYALYIKLLNAALHDEFPVEQAFHLSHSTLTLYCATTNSFVYLPQYVGIALVAGLRRGCKAAWVAPFDAAGRSYGMTACT